MNVASRSQHSNVGFSGQHWNVCKYYQHGLFGNLICKGLPPTAPRGPAGEGHQRMRSSQVSKSEALREPNTKAPGLRFSFSAPPADGRGLWIGIFSRKFRESYAKERRKSKCMLHEGGGPVNFAKKICPEKGFRDASCIFKRLPRSDPWFSGVIWQVVNESS